MFLHSRTTLKHIVHILFLDTSSLLITGYLQTNMDMKYGIYLAGYSLCVAGVIFAVVAVAQSIVMYRRQKLEL